MITVDNSVNIHVNSEPAQLSLVLTYRICFSFKVTCKISCDVGVYTDSHIENYNLDLRAVKVLVKLCENKVFHDPSLLITQMISTKIKCAGLY